MKSPLQSQQENISKSIDTHPWKDEEGKERELFIKLYKEFDTKIYNGFEPVSQISISQTDMDNQINQSECEVISSSRH